LEDELMGNKEAWASASPPTITIRQSRYANPDSPETRFILAHELFHIVLHPEGRSFLVAGGNTKLPFHHKDDLLAILHNDQSHEVQADVAARAFLMPRKLVMESPSLSALADLCCVPRKDAKLRYALVKPARRSPAEVRAFLIESKSEERQRLWSQLPLICGEPPDQYRQAGLYRVAWNEFERTTECGWTISNGKIVPYMDIHAAWLGR
jgi:hypothetical protein